MNRKLLSALIVLGLALPGAAQARVTPAELHRDAAQVHHEEWELVRAKAHHNHREARHERRELHRAKHELHRDARAYAHQHRR